MSSFNQFTKELHILFKFYKATLYAYEQTDLLLFKCRKNKDEMATVGLFEKQPSYYKSKGKGISENQKNLSEVIFVRFVSALEVYLVDQVREIFLVTKEPFKKQHSKPEFSQAELLSMNSPADIFDKIINKETRKLSSGGFNIIIKYYKDNFQINLSDISPGLTKMEEYHQRRHLLVHRLGRTDEHYRKKFNCQLSKISVDEVYLKECFENFKTFSEIVETKLRDKIKNNFSVSKVEKEKEVKSIVLVEILKGQPSIFDNNFEFWAGDEFCMFSKILTNRVNESDSKFKITLAGTNTQISSYSTILKREVDRNKIRIEYITKKGKDIIEQTPKKRLDKATIEKIRKKLIMEQPNPPGIHKTIASELGLSNKIVRSAINYIYKNETNSEEF